MTGTKKSSFAHGFGRAQMVGGVTKHSIALDLEEGVFTWDDPKKIAKSLKNSRAGKS